MEPVTHLLTGACLSRAGLNRRAAYATLTMVIAAEFPDIDTLWSLRGPVESFQHHRGITHTFLGLPFEAALIVAAVYGWHRWRLRRAGIVSAANPTTTATTSTGVLRSALDDGEKQATTTATANATADVRRRRRPLTAAPVRWGVLYGLALVALLSHLLLDYTNNYGLRPFFPFDDRWYAASIVFIFDPLMFGMLLGALVLPWLFGLVGSEVGAKKQPFRGRGWAIAALLGIVGWWMLREVEHGHAVQLAMAQSLAAPETPASGQGGATGVVPAPAEGTPTYLPAQRVLVNPDPVSPFHWSGVTDFGPVYQMSEIDTGNGALMVGETTYPKPERSLAVLGAEGSKLGRAYLDWSPMPFVDASQAGSGADAGGAATVVTFRDPRFMGGWMRETGRSGLVGTVTVDAAGKVIRETMDGRVER